MEAASVSQSKRHKSSGSGLALKNVDCLGDPRRRPAALWMFRHFFETNGDPQVYGDIAKNLLLHGRYALTVGSGQAFPTLDPAARLSRIPRPVFSTLWDRELHRGGLGADRDGTGGLPFPRRFRTPDCSTGTQDWRHARSAMARRALPLYSSVCGEPADGGANALCPGACALVARLVFRKAPPGDLPSRLLLR